MNSCSVAAEDFGFILCWRGFAVRLVVIRRGREPIVRDMLARFAASDVRYVRRAAAINMAVI